MTPAGGRRSRPRATSALRRAPRAVVILAAYPKRAPAERAARDLVASGLLACATVTYGARAFYRWKGKAHADPSTLLWGKTTRARAPAAVRGIRERHPDDVPEILVLPILGGHAPYLAWLEAEVTRR